MSTSIDTAMVLAAGLGTRIRPISGDKPKPLVEVAGRPLIDWTLDYLATGGVARAVVNVHYMADQLEAHLRARTGSPEVIVSDEREALLNTGGALMLASPYFSGPIISTNTDAIIDDPEGHAIASLCEAWDDGEMDGLLLLVPIGNATGYAGKGDFVLGADGRIGWEGEGPKHIFTGLQILHPRLWAGEPVTRQSTTVFWNRAMKAGRLHGHLFEGAWRHVGDPEGHAAAEMALTGR